MIFTLLFLSLLVVNFVKYSNLKRMLEALVDNNICRLFCTNFVFEEFYLLILLTTACNKNIDVLVVSTYHVSVNCMDYFVYLFFFIILIEIPSWSCVS